jgi:Uma2 family endonuclease
MVIRATIDRSSPAQYLALERTAEARSEYIDGQIVAMTGASRAHNQLSVNLTVTIAPQLRATPCELYASDMRVKVADTGLYTYPDIVVVCGDPELEDAHQDTLLNPTVIVEILSPSTEAYDRGEKFARYRRLRSLRTYLLVSPDRVRVEQFVRRADEWVLSTCEDADGELTLPALGITLRMRELYDRVSFEPAAAREAARHS